MRPVRFLHDLRDSLHIGEVGYDLCEAAADRADFFGSLLTAASCDSDHIRTGGSVSCADPLSQSCVCPCYEGGLSFQ